MLVSTADLARSIPGQSGDKGGDHVDTELGSPAEHLPLYMQWRPYQCQSYKQVFQRKKEDQWRQALPAIRDSVISRAPT